MSADPNGQSIALSRSVVAAALILDGKTKEHEAACLVGNRIAIDEARHTFMSAAEALLDARESLYRAMLLGA